MVGTVEPLDLNLLRIFERVASLAGFSAAARALGLPKSNVSRGVAKLEATLRTRLFQRTTRHVVLTAAGQALRERCAVLLEGLGEAVEYVSGFADAPHGHIKISSGVGFGVNVLAEALPAFLDRYPDVRVTLDLSTRSVDLVAEGVDCAVRLGPLRDSSLISTQLGAMNRYLCAAPSYLAKRGSPATIDDLARHDAIEMPGANGRAFPWTFRRGSEMARVDPQPRVCVDEALAIFRLVKNGAGIGVLSAYLCGPEVVAGRLVRLLPDWSCPAVPVSLVYPSRRELAPTVRAFTEFMKEASETDSSWRDDPLTRG
jgi:DNA-binding transcriptional LysR family regulator